MPVEILLDRLEGVRQTGAHQWRARCPAHGSKSQSLSIRETDEHRVLLHCFGGCDTGEVLSAVGLTVSALFEKVTPYNVTSSKSTFNAREALACVDHEVLVALLICQDVLKDGHVNAEQHQRLALASTRISDARAMSCPARVSQGMKIG